MKKIFRFLAVTALCGASLVYVGCTKDYSKEISDVKKDLTALQEGTIATHTQQIAALQQADKDLKAVDEALKKSIETVQSNLDAAKADLQTKINAKADQTTVAALETRVKTLETNLTALTSRVAVVEDAIKTINTTLATKADKSWVEQTFATKAALKEVSDALGALTTRVDAAEKDIKDLQAADTRIEKEYKEADTKLAGDIAAVKEVADKAAEDIIAINGQIDRLWANFDNYYQKAKVDELINKAKEELQEKIDAEKQAREIADAKNLDSLEKVRVKLQNQIDVLNNEVIPALQQKDNELKAAIDTVEKHLNNEIVARIAKDAALKDSIDSVARCYRQADEALQDQIDVLKSRMNAVSDSVKQEISDRIQAISDAKDEINGKIGDLSQLATTDKSNIVAALNEEIANRVNAISGLQTQIDGINTEIGNIKTKLAKLEEKVDALAGRVNSISVCPTLSEEIMWVKAGKDSVKVIGATFEVSPASAAEYFTVDNTVINVAEARPRVKGGVEFEQFVPDTIAVDANTGRIKVIAHGLKDLKDDNNAYFFCCTFQAEDTAGVYNVTSDYALAVEKGATVDISSSFCYTNGVEYSVANTRKNFRPTRTLNYLQAADTVFTPYDSISVVFNNKAGNYPFLAKQAYTIEQFTKLTGLEVKVSHKSIGGLAKPFQVLSNIDSLELKGNCVPDQGSTCRDYVGAKGGYNLDLFINEKDNCHGIAQVYEITKIVHETVSVPTLNLYWNYKTLKPEDSKDTVIFEPKTLVDSLWKEAIARNIKATSQIYTHATYSAFFDFGVWKDNDYKTLNAVCKKFNLGSVLNKSEIVKEDNNDKYTFKVVVHQWPRMFDVDTTCVSVADENNNKYPNNGYNTVRVTFTNLAAQFVYDKKGNFNTRLVQGLTGDEATPAAAKSAAFDVIEKAIRSASSKITINGITATQRSLTGSNPGSDWSQFAFPFDPYFTYGENTVTFEVEVFGVKYKYTCKVITTKNPLELKLNEFYVNPADSVATTRGNFVNKVYSIDEMWHAHFVKIAGKPNVAGYTYNVAFNTYPAATPATMWGTRSSDRGDFIAFGKTSAKDTCEVNPTSLELANTTKYMWNTYKGRKMKVGAKLITSKDGRADIVSDELFFYIETPRPLVTSATVQSQNRTTGVDLPFNIWKNFSVKGSYDDGGVKTTGNLIKDDGSFDPNYQYKGSKLVYHVGTFNLTTQTITDPNKIKTVEGVELTKGIDFKYDASTPGVFTFLKESAVASTITIPVWVELQYDLDYLGKQSIFTKVELKVVQ